MSASMLTHDQVILMKASVTKLTKAVTVGCCWCLQVDRVVESALSQHGRVDGVVNCVGNVVARSTLATDLQQLQEELEVCTVEPF